MEQKNTWLIKICCVIAAFSLWLYIVNVGDYAVTRTVTVPVDLVNVQSVTERKLAILPGQKFMVTLNVKGTPSDIELNKDQFKVVADMSMYALSKGEIRIPVIIERQPVNVTVLNSGSYYIKVEFDDYVEKTVPVKFNIEGKLKEGFYALEESISPTEVSVSGAARYVNKVVRAEASKNIENLDKDLNLRLPLKAVDDSGKEVENVNLNINVVEVKIPIKETKTLPVKINTKGTLKKDIHLKSLTAVPDKIEVVLKNDTNNITYIETEPIDLSSITSSEEIPVKIIPKEGVILLNNDNIIKVKAIVEKVESKTLTKDISIKNLNDNFTASLSSVKANITVLGLESVIDKINNENINCFVDLSSLNSEGEYSIKVNTSIPYDLSNITVNPETIKVVLKKKETQTVNDPSQNVNTTPIQGGQ
jgi:YbbR domain-containing protein